jgi:hypothetical protein
MHFNWLTNLPKDQSFSRLAIELEYELRPRITRYLLRKFEQDFGDDFSSFYFDVDVNTQWVRIGRSTPERFRMRLAQDFDAEINGSQQHLHIAYL